MLQQSIALALSEHDLYLMTKVRRALFALIVQYDVTIDDVATMVCVHIRRPAHRTFKNCV